MSAETEYKIAHWNQSRWLVLSSCFFIIPSIYAFQTNQYVFSGLLILTSMASANYWRNATYSWRRDLELIIAKTNFCIFFFNGIWYVQYRPYVITGYISLVYLIYCYNMSAKIFGENKTKPWFLYHMMFHLLLVLNQMMILDSTKK